MGEKPESNNAPSDFFYISLVIKNRKHDYYPEKLFIIK